jgi:Uma2 family endonuclease
MSAVAKPKVMTTEEMLALPDDGMDRELIQGQLRERPMTKRNMEHSSVAARLTQILANWLDQKPGFGGRVVSGEAGFRLRRNPDTSVGIDVAYVSAEVVAKSPKKTAFFEGPPVLAVEIFSPSDKHEEIVEKTHEYLEAGVPLVWWVDPEFRTVMVHRPGTEPELFNVRQELSGEPHLPGFRVPVADLFKL